MAGLCFSTLYSFSRLPEDIVFMGGFFRSSAASLLSLLGRVGGLLASAAPAWPPVLSVSLATVALSASSARMPL